MSRTPPADQGPHHLAQTVLRALSVSGPEPPDRSAVHLFFFSALYEASFRPDQGAPLRGRVVWQEPTAARPSDAPEYLRLTPPVPFSVGSLASLLARANRRRPCWSRQARRILLSSGASHSGPTSLCTSTACSSAELLGPAHLKVEAGLDYPIELRRNRLHSSDAESVRARPGPGAAGGTACRRCSRRCRACCRRECWRLAAAGCRVRFRCPAAACSCMNEQDWPDTLEQFWVMRWRCCWDRLRRRIRGGLVLLTPRRENTAAKTPGSRRRMRRRLSPAAAACWSSVRPRRLCSRSRPCRPCRRGRLRCKTASPDDLALQEPGLPREIAGLRRRNSRAPSRFLASLVACRRPSAA